MPKTKEQKKEILDSLKEKLQSSKSVVFSSDQGLDVKSVEELRNKMRENGGEYLVAKKTLLRIATEDLGENEVIDQLEGSVGVTLSYEDEVSGAQLLDKFAKDHEKLNIGGGILENKFILADMVKKLATLPSKEGLLAKLVGTLNAPMTGMVNVLSGNTRGLVNVLNAIKEKKQ